MNNISIAEMKRAARHIAGTNGLFLVLLFGSRARGTPHAKSDFDFGVLGMTVLLPKEIARLSFLFSQEMKIKERNIEIVDLKSAPPLLLKRVAKEAISLYEKEPQLFTKFKVYALKRYFEAKPLLDLRRSALNKFLQAA